MLQQTQQTRDERDRLQQVLVQQSIALSATEEFACLEIWKNETAFKILSGTQQPQEEVKEEVQRHDWQISMQEITGDFVKIIDQITREIEVELQCAIKTIGKVSSSIQDFDKDNQDNGGVLIKFFCEFRSSFKSENMN